MSGRGRDIANGSWIGAAQGARRRPGTGTWLCCGVGEFAWRLRKSLGRVALRLRSLPVMISFRWMRYWQVSAPKPFSHGPGWGTVGDIPHGWRSQGH